MPPAHQITYGGATFTARAGERLLDAALANGVDMPHDCRAGRCGACLTRVVRGITLGGETSQPGSVHACQAMVFSDLSLVAEPLPPVVRVTGKVVRLAVIAEEVVEVTIALAGELEMLPGQFCRFHFKGFDPRPFSPTAALTTLRDDGLLRLNIKRVRNGRVTSHLGSLIKSGHAVSVEGPYGHAYLRPGGSERLVLVGSGTGFAPIWAVCAAALREDPGRRITLIAAVRRLAALHMASAIQFARRFPNVQVRACIDELPRDHGLLTAGRAIEHVPALDRNDIVYAAGAPRLVEDVGQLAQDAGATFHADPFITEPPPSPRAIDRLRAWLLRT